MDKKFYSQTGQDKHLEKYVFGDYKNGFYVDVGSHNGIDINNTLYFSKNYNWKGINIEPIPRIFEELVKNRETDININCAVSDENGSENFINVTGYPEMISGLEKNYDPRHKKRLNRELKSHGGKKEIIKVKTRKLENIFEEHSVKRVNYLDIDVEGAEFSVIKSIDFSKVFIDVIGFENNYPDVSVDIVKFLEEKNYKRILKNIPCFDIFMINKDSEFNKNLN